MTNFVTTKRALLTSVLSLVLCFAMLLGTTFAWFTDSVTSSGNVIQTGDLDVEMYYANGTEDPSTAGWKNADGVAIFNYDNWEPGYADAKHIKIVNAGTLAFDWMLRITSSDVVGELAEVIDVYYFATASAYTRDAVKNATPLGTLREVMNTAKNISNTVKGTLLADTETAFTIVLVMQEDAGNEYQNLSIGSDLSIEVFATQRSYEKDSFDENYDSNVPSMEFPAAYVREIGKDEVIKNSTTTLVNKGLIINAAGTNTSIGGHPIDSVALDTAYQFLPTETYSDSLKSYYVNWHADYVVKMDGDVAPESLALAGYYDAWGPYNGYEWVALAPDQTIDAGTEIRLISLLGNGSITVNYESICSFGNDGIGFLCGAVDLDGSNAGKTLTVELRIYETLDKYHEEHTRKDGTYCNGATANCETGEYTTIGEFKYTFPKTVDTVEGLADALVEGGTITLAAGEYKMPSNQSSEAELKIVGTKDTVIDVTLGAYMEKANVTFEGVTIKTGTGYANGNGSDYAALYSPDVTYINCTFEGPMRVGCDGAKFINCTFNSLGNDYVWTYGNDVTFEGCTFNTDGKAILIYSDGGTEVSEVKVINCTFNSTTGAKAGAIANQNCAAIEIHNYGNGVNLVTEGNTYDSNFSGEWRIKTYESGKPQVFVNGTEYTQIAIDGKLMTIDGNKNVTVQ